MGLVSFLQPIPSEPWTVYILNAPVADPPSALDYLALVQGGAIKRLPYGTDHSARVIPITSGASYQVTAVGDVIAVKKIIPSTTSIVLEAAPIDGRRVQVGDWAGNAETNPITVSGNGNLIQGATSYPLVFNYQSAIFTYSSVFDIWNVS